MCLRISATETKRIAAPVKIGIDVRKIGDYGIGTHIRNVVLRAAQIATGHEFFVYHDPRDTIEGFDPDHTIAESAGKYSIQEHFSLPRKARQNRLDLFHSPHYTLPLFMDCPSIVTIHDLIHLKFQHYFPFWKVQAAKYVIANAAKKARRIITVSRTTRNDLLDWMPELHSKVDVIYNRLNEEFFQPPPPIDLQSLGVYSEFLLYAGNFKKHKGIDTLLEAYQKRPDLPQLVLVGQGHSMDHELTERILSTQKVRLLGFAGNSILRALYSKALIFLFPSRYEGFGYPPLEAMAAGSPVLSSSAPAMKEILGDAADFFDTGNAEDLLAKLQRLLTDADRRKALRDAGALQAKKFASEESPRKLAQLWESTKATTI